MSTTTKMSTTTITIDLDTLSADAAEAISQALLDDGDNADAALAIVQHHGTSVVMADDGNAEVEMVSDTLAAAAREYVEDGDWGDDRSETSWVTIYAWRRWTLGDVEIDEERDSFDVEIEPEEPECDGEHEHDWCSPYAVVGGIRENPGVWGHGGGVIIHEICRHCGCLRTTDTWAQNPETGEQGLRAVSYERLGDHEHSEAWEAWRAP